MHDFDKFLRLSFDIFVNLDRALDQLTCQYLNFVILHLIAAFAVTIFNHLSACIYTYEKQTVLAVDNHFCVMINLAFMKLSSYKLSRNSEKKIARGDSDLAFDQEISLEAIWLHVPLHCRTKLSSLNFYC